MKETIIIHHQFGITIQIIMGMKRLLNTIILKSTIKLFSKF